jgi:hypothetical protein
MIAEYKELLAELLTAPHKTFDVLIVKQVTYEGVGYDADWLFGNFHKLPQETNSWPLSLMVHTELEPDEVEVLFYWERQEQPTLGPVYYFYGVSRIHNVIYLITLSEEGNPKPTEGQAIPRLVEYRKAEGSELDELAPLMKYFKK